MNIMDFKDKHKGERGLLVGTGPSVRHSDVKIPLGGVRNELPTIGVNDAERYHSVNYLLMVDPIGRFADERRAAIESSEAVRFIAQPFCGPYPVPCVDYYLDPRVRGKTGLPNGNGTLIYYKDTPYIAMSLAYWMGFTELGLIGVDHSGDHFRIGPQWLDIRRKYDEQCRIYHENGMRCVKLSWLSGLALPYVPYEEWVK